MNEAPKSMSARRLRKTAREHSALALETLADIMRGGGQDAVRLAAAREILDRAHGKPKADAGDPRAGRMTVVVKRFTDAPDPYAQLEDQGRP